MRTIKLVVIGPSGVGKTSLRGKYISGRFSGAYRATIGADFISKTFPHPSEPDQSITLQIWDTAGQERFSSLSTAFFRGADAVLLMFDVNAPQTMASLQKWWMDFCNQAPLADEDVDEFPCIVVGNKIDMISSDSTFVTESEALVFLDTLVPSSSSSPRIPDIVSPNLIRTTPSSPPRNNIPFPIAHSLDASHSPLSTHPRSTSIDITPSPLLHPSTPTSRQLSHSPKHHLSKSRSRAPSSRFYSGTMTSTHTTLSIYHTPSSSVFDVYESARASPEPRLSTASSLSTSTSARGYPIATNIRASTSSPLLTLPSSFPPTSRNEDTLPAVPLPSSTPGLASTPPARTRRLTNLSNGSASSGSGVTITPSLFARERAASAAASSTFETSHANQLSGSNPQQPDLGSSLPSPQPSSVPLPYAITPLPLPPERGPRLFFTSAKTGEGVDDVFMYIVQRVLRKWEFEDEVEARRLHFREASGASTVTDSRGQILRLGFWNAKRENGPGGSRSGGAGGTCC